MRRRDASVESAGNRIPSLLPILEQYSKKIEKAERQLRQTLQQARQSRPDDAEIRDAAILDSIPGIGDHVLATLLTEAEQAIRQRHHARGNTREADRHRPQSPQTESRSPPSALPNLNPAGRCNGQHQIAKLHQRGHRLA